MKYSRLIVLLISFIIGFSIMIFALINIYIIDIIVGIICTVFTAIFLVYVFKMYKKILITEVKENEN